MKINIKLSESSIENAISKLEEILENLMQDVGETVDILLTDGAEVANIAYGEMATAWGIRDSEEDGVVSGHIGVRGASDDVVYIAEFGAGDSTMEVIDFENPPPVDVYAGAYSEQKGSGEYAESLEASGGVTGTWHFGGQEYHEVMPRHGLLNAKAHILASAEDIAREVILHD